MNANNLNMSNNQVQDYINNSRINLNAPGNQGRYTRSTHFHTLEEWDSIFSHLSVYSAGVHATADLLQGMLLRRPDHRRLNYAYDSFPLIIWIPLPCSIPHFSRCILHVEEVNPRTNTLSGSSFIPVEITHHDNHPITPAIAHMFREDRHPHRHQYPPSYQTNESLVFATARENEAIRQMCACLTQGGNNFAAYDAAQDANRNEQHADLNTASRHILYDPETLARANSRVNELMLAHAQQAQQGRGVHEMTIQESQQVHRAWREVVFPETTAEERRYAYARYAADQIMMHRYVHDNHENNNPCEPNPILLPFHNDDDDHHHHHQHHENNPVDRARQEQAPENVYIQELYNGQNNDERARVRARARITAQDVAVHPVHPPL
jgi:hypothetical protein